MKLHPLHTASMLAAHMAQTGEYFPKDRCTGRSTIGALQFIVKAMQNPYTWVAVTDHSMAPNSRRMMLILIQGIVLRLHFEHFEFKEYADPDGSRRYCMRFGRD